MQPQTPCPQQDGAREHVCASQQPCTPFLDPTQHTDTYQTLRSGVHRVQRSALVTTPAYQNRANLPAFIEPLGTQRECRAAGPRAALRSWTELGAMCTALSQPLPAPRHEPCSVLQALPVSRQQPKHAAN